ncbi:MSH2 [Candida pseudojiufengensis]|uniref:MSH2 n=1 Tax=Candida pseudojiufengensis TaxID=497109 RepID=UPI002224A305|nr:MSH2 [Candida pseudojiufengensis]KAI5965965.1 MSH2 [Candida pseudojiufengensis]
MSTTTNIAITFAGTGNEKQFIKNLQDKDPSTIRFIDHNNKDYFSCLQEDAELIAKDIYKTRSIIKFSDNVKYVTISPQVFQTALKLYLLEKQYRVEIYNNKNYQILASGTAGNLEGISQEYGINFEFQDCSNSTIAGIKINGNNVGVCIMEDDKIFLTEFEDNDLYSNLESLLLQFGVKEVLIPESKDDKLERLIDKIGNILITKSKNFNTKNIEQDLSKLLEEENIDLCLSSKGINVSEFQKSLSGCNALMIYLNLLTETRQYNLEKYDLNEYMRVDTSTMKALNIFPEFQSTTTINSIFELLNKCKTSAGSRLLSQWLKQPLTNVESIEERQGLIELAMNNATLRVEVQSILSQIPDIKRLLKKLTLIHEKPGYEQKKLEDIVTLYKVVLLLPDLIEILKGHNELVDKWWFNPLSTRFQALFKFQELVETTIDLKGLHDLHSNFAIRPEFDKTLISINETKTASLDQIKNLHLDVANDLNMDSEKKLKLENHQIHGFCLRLTRADSIVIRNNKKYQELQTVKAGVYFTTTELKNLSQIYLESCDAYNTKQRKLVTEVLGICLSYSKVLTLLSLDLAHLDVIISLSNVALIASKIYTKPKLIPLNSTNRKINLKESRHPLLEIQDDLEFIPNDVSINSKYFNIITGPNMGGKSTYLKQIATIGLMAQIGSFIPAEEGAELPILDAILSRVGAGDSQLKGLSTFMIEMLETSSILATASTNSLIVIDELGRGTSTYDGFGLAYAISEHLVTKMKCFTLFATHFHDLTKLADQYPKEVENLHVVAYVENQEDITLMYKIEPGISSKSFGINVAEMVKFDEKIIKMAKRKAEELEKDKLKRLCNSKEVNDDIVDFKDKLKKLKDDNSSEPLNDKLKSMLDAGENKYMKEIMTSL